MKKIMEYQIEEEWMGKPVNLYLKQELHLTAAQIRSLKFHEDGIWKNGERCRVNQMLQKGDQLRITLQEKETGVQKVKASGFMPEVLYEDKDVICVWKMSGRVTHPVAGHEKDTVAGDLVTYFAAKKEQVTVRSIGRLDKDTSGILVFAKNRVAAARLWEQRSQGIFQKEYLAWCRGVFPKEAMTKEQCISMPIGKNRSVCKEGQKMHLSADGKMAITRYQVLVQQEEQALVRFYLETGRTHQIRVHMAGLGHPLVGDSLYGSGIHHQDAAKLCAWKVEFLQPFTEQKVELEYRDPLYFSTSLHCPPV